MEQFENTVSNIDFTNILTSLNESFLNEREDIVYYDYLIEIAPTREEKEIINSIKYNKQLHAQILRKLYRELSGVDISFQATEKLLMPQSYLDGIKAAFPREVKEVEYYKFIKDKFPFGSYRDIISQIIVDKTNNVSKLNYLVTLNSKFNNNYTSPNTFNLNLNSWISYIKPLVSRGLAEISGNITPEALLRKYILSGILIGLGKRPLEALEIVESQDINRKSTHFY
ncbi:ferritin-like domain-containing protein [Clostridium cibarium]|uniref:Ferritin-like domain-containing protein n=1 Tax=Clostridium cibarium TaxID=2762247 RepID=A0ABR8PWA2_9CLOT|nr:ferritin-like domain-containing protein [Clostridium cibarium]MBD7912454.1 ferritin-like domain-containing protein [Clostridium cibarium]